MFLNNKQTIHVQTYILLDLLNFLPFQLKIKFTILQLTSLEALRYYKS